ncbi:MAG: DUF4377 domain-containing protein [Idiomarina sp.]
MDITPIFRRSTLLSLAFISTLLVGCGGSDGPKSEILILSVGEKPEVCAGRQINLNFICLPAAYLSSTDEFEVDSRYIQGFTPEFGVSYELRVQKDPFEYQISDPPYADYTLLETLTEVQVAQVGDTYAYDIPLDGYMFNVEDGNYFLGEQHFNYQFNCGEGVDCQQLVDMDGSGSLVTIELTYVGGEVPITLTYWN